MNIISLHTSINGPGNYFKNLGWVTGKLTKNKFWELEHYIQCATLFNFDLSFSVGENHAGFNFEIGLLGYNIHYKIYDVRHWDHLEHRWFD